MDDTKKCELCRDCGTIEVLCCGGDYETQPCPECRPEEHRRHNAEYYEDGEAD